MKYAIHTVFPLMGHTTFHLLFYSSDDKYLLVSVTFHFTAPLPALEHTDTAFPATQRLTGKTSTSRQHQANCIAYNFLFQLWQIFNQNKNWINLLLYFLPISSNLCSLLWVCQLISNEVSICYLTSQTLVFCCLPWDATQIRRSVSSALLCVAALLWYYSHGVFVIKL